MFDLKTYNALIKFQIHNKLPLNGTFDEKNKQKLLENFIDLTKNPTSTSFPSGYIALNDTTQCQQWEDKEWQYALRLKNKNTKKILIQLSYYKVSNIAFILYLIGFSESFILTKDKKYLNNIKENCYIFDSYNYTNYDKYLQQGDILISKDDIAIVLTDGENAKEIITTEVIAKVQKVRNPSEKKLNIRYRPSFESGVVTQLKPGATFVIVEEKNGWGKLRSGKGWVNLKFVEKL